jgi:CBS domain containing-hemolysin-like protein
MVALLLVLVNAFSSPQVCALVAVVNQGSTRWQRPEGDQALVVQRALQQLDRYICRTRLGITLASLAWAGSA